MPLLLRTQAMRAHPRARGLQANACGALAALCGPETPGARVQIVSGGGVLRVLHALTWHAGDESIAANGKLVLQNLGLVPVPPSPSVCEQPVGQAEAENAAAEGCACAACRGGMEGESAAKRYVRAILSPAAHQAVVEYAVGCLRDLAERAMGEHGHMAPSVGCRLQAQIVQAGSCAAVLHAMRALPTVPTLQILACSVVQKQRHRLAKQTRTPHGCVHRRRYALVPSIVGVKAATKPTPTCVGTHAVIPLNRVQLPRAENGLMGNACWHVPQGI